MIIGIGSDLLDIRRFEKVMARFEARFLRRSFTEIERAKAEKRRPGGTHIATLAKRFAAKEAVYKALGRSGVTGLSWREAETTNDCFGVPHIRLSGRCKIALERLTPDGCKAQIHVSLSDEPPYALAYIVISVCFIAR